MKKYSIYLFAAAAALLSAACSSGSDSVDTDPEVTFTTEVTRADVQTALGSGAQMNVYLSQTGTVVSKTAVLHQGLCTGSTWKGVPPIYLKPKEEQFLFAIWPYAQEATDATKYPVTAAAQTDYLYSGAGVSVSYEKPTAVLKMRHAMAIFAFDVRSYVGGRLSRIEIGGEEFPTAGELRVTSGKITVRETGSYAHTCDLALSEQGSGDGATFFVIPFELKPAKEVEVKMQVGGKEYSCQLPVREYKGNTKYVFHTNLTEAGLSLLPEQVEEISLDEAAGVQPAGAHYGLLRIKHHAESIVVPEVAGTEPWGMIYWGDGKSEPYASGKSYTYTTPGAQLLSIDLWGADGATFSSLKGIEEIDFSKF